MPYSQEISRATPACFLFLLDQSGSMLDPFGGNPASRKCDELALAVNAWIQNISAACTKGSSPDPLDYFYIGIIGYRTDVVGNPLIENALPPNLAGSDLVPISQLYASPRGRQTLKQKGFDPETGELLEMDVELPFWIEPKAEGGTPMCSALHKAHGILDQWTQQRPGGFPPVIVHITDGESTEGDPEQYAAPIMDLATQDGNVLIFNCHLSMTAADPIMFPNNDEIMPEEFARTLYRISSVIPQTMAGIARQSGYDLQPNARGMVFNAGSDSLLKFLDIGTQTNASLLR
jgi:hypothetical protein